MVLRNLRPAVLVALLALGVTSCGDDTVTPPPTTGAVQGSVVDVNGTALPGIGLILVDPASVSTASALGRTDVAGRYRIDGVQPGDFSVFVYDADSLAGFARTAPLVHVTAGATSVHDVTLIDSGLWRRGPLFIAGTVTDATSGAPVAGALVSAAIWASMEQYQFQGITVPDWGVTDAAGRFTITATDATVIGSGSLGLLPISVARAGYEPATLVGRGADYFGLGPPLPFPTTPDSTLQVAVVLRPTSAAVPKRALRGRVVFAGGPVAGVRVVLALRGVADPDTIPGPVGKSRGVLPGIDVLVPDRTAVTDGSGRFSIGDVHPGWYVVHVAVLPTDGFIGDVREVRVAAASDTTDCGDITAVPAMAVLAPAPGSHPPANQTVELQWSPPTLPAGIHVARYKIQIGLGYLLELQTTTRQPALTVEAMPAGTPVRWLVDAVGVIDASGDSIRAGSMEEAASFTVAGPVP